jgi:hypothetical protein
MPWARSSLATKLADGNGRGHAHQHGSASTVLALDVLDEIDERLPSLSCSSYWW